jgi:metal-responsive CopG/Arc/MetJ family transcriptional regulator
MKLSLIIPDKVIEELDTFVDGIKFRSRAHLITCILVDWITLNKGKEWLPAQIKGKLFTEKKVKT